MTDQTAYPEPASAGAPVPDPRVQTEGMATVALLLAIGSWVVIPVILAVTALFAANSAASTIAASGGAKTGLGLVKAATLISWLNLIFWGLVIVFGLAFLVGLAIGD